MSEVDIYRPSGTVERREPHRDIDSWIQVVSDVIKIANVICDTPFVPDGLRGSAPAVAAAILSGREMGLGMMTSLANIDVIRGKPTQKPLLMRAMILERGHKWIDVDVTDTRAVVRGCRKGESEWTEVAFTADQAKKAGLNLGNYPADKLYARASSRLARRRFADVIMGMPYTPEDMEDGIDDDEIGTVTESATPAIEPPKPDKPRTAQRKTREPRPTAARAATASAPTAAPAPAQTAPSGDSGDLPPLPGEEEDSAPAMPDPTTSGASSSAHAPGSGSRQGNGARSPSSPGGSGTTPDDTDYDTPGTVTPMQLKAIWTVLGEVYHFDKDDRDSARGVCAHVIGRDLESSKHLSKNEAKAVLDTLAHWQHQAQQAGDDARAWMITVMAAPDAEAEVPGDE